MDIVFILKGILAHIWHTIDDAAIYILFGVFISGLIPVFVNQDKIAQYLGNKGFKSVFLASVFGIPLPLCSCGVLPAAISLRKNGASKGATISFLISTPETGIDSIALSYALLDPLMTIIRPIIALITAIVAGIVENILGKNEGKNVAASEYVCLTCDEHLYDENVKHTHSYGQKFKAGMRYAFIDLLNDISGWLLLGLVVAGIITYFVPSELIENYLGYGWGSMFFMLILGIPLYVCASASTPIAAALIAKGMSPGAALVFLLVGPATNIASLLVVAKFLGKKSAVVYLVSIALCAVLAGLLLNQIYLISGIDIKTTLGKASEIFPHPIKVLTAIILIVLMMNARFLNLRKGHKDCC